MSVTTNNRIMQSSVGYQIQEQAGAVGQDRLSLSWDIDSDVADNTEFGYGAPVFLGSNSGVVPAAASSTVTILQGFVKYENSGVIDYAGYRKDPYTNLPVLRQGVMYLPASGTVTLSSTPYLQVDATKTGYGKLMATNATGCIDVSTVVKVLKPAANNVVLCDIQIL